MGIIIFNIPGIVMAAIALGGAIGIGALTGVSAEGPLMARRGAVDEVCGNEVFHISNCGSTLHVRRSSTVPVPVPAPDLLCPDGVRSDPQISPRYEAARETA